VHELEETWIPCFSFKKLWMQFGNCQRLGT